MIVLTSHQIDIRVQKYASDNAACPFYCLCVISRGTNVSIDLSKYGLRHR